MRIFRLADNETGKADDAIGKSAGTFTDRQLWALHGTHPDAYREAFKPIKDKRNAMISAATKLAESLGHALFRNWTPLFNSNRCRKCGMTVALPNVYAATSSPDAIGAAVESHCKSHLDSAPPDLFEITDSILDSGVPLNRDQLTAIAGNPVRT